MLVHSFLVVLSDRRLDSLHLHTVSPGWCFGLRHGSHRILQPLEYSPRLSSLISSCCSHPAVPSSEAWKLGLLGTFREGGALEPRPDRPHSLTHHHRRRQTHSLALLDPSRSQTTGTSLYITDIIPDTHRRRLIFLHLFSHSKASLLSTSTVLYLTPESLQHPYCRNTYRPRCLS